MAKDILKRMGLNIDPQWTPENSISTRLRELLILKSCFLCFT